MASSKKKKSSKKPVAKAKKKAAPAKKSAKGKKAAAPKKATAKAKPKAAPKKKAPAKKAAPAKKNKKAPMAGDSWGNAALAPRVEESSPQPKMTEPSDNPVHALHDHEGTLVSPVDEQEELAERIHGGEEAVKDEDLDDDAGSPRLDDREDDEA